MRHNSSFRRGQKKAEERKKLLKAASIPLVVIVLLIVIAAVDHIKKEPEADEAKTAVVSETLLEPSAEETSSDDGESGASEEITGQETESEQESETESEGTDEMQEMEASEPVIQKDSHPELLSMMKDYYEARANGDAELLNKLYGIEGLSIAALEAEKTRMRSNSKYLRGFDHIVTYVSEGLNEKEWLVYSTCDMYFHSVETVAPMIMWCYVVEQEDGTLLIQKPEDLSPQVLQHVDLVNRSQEVRSLASDINVRLKEALLADEALNEVYGVLRDGSPVYQDREEKETEAVQILSEESETEAAAETNTESEGSETNTEIETEGSETNPESEAETGSNAETESGAVTEEETETE